MLACGFNFLSLPCWLRMWRSNFMPLMILERTYACVSIFWCVLACFGTFWHVVAGFGTCVWGSRRDEWGGKKRVNVRDRTVDKTFTNFAAFVFTSGSSKCNN
jgi:hypothetical protein